MDYRMNSRPPIPLRRNPAACLGGFTLIELMIAVTIALVVLLAVSQAYIGGLKSKQGQTDMARLNETARFAFDLFSRQARKAGYVNSWSPGAASPGNFCTNQQAIRGLDGPATINPTAVDLIGTTQTVLNNSDVFRVSYYGEDTPDGTAADNSMLDCQGYPLRRGTLTTDVLFVATDPATLEPSLFCYTSNPAPVVAGSHPGSLALVTGVESLHILYGEDTDLDGVVNRYVPWGTAGLDGARVISLKLSVVVRSPTASSTDTTLQTYNHFGTAYSASAVANGDTGISFTPTTGAGRQRTMLSTEIGLRNFGDC